MRTIGGYLTLSSTILQVCRDFICSQHDETPHRDIDHVERLVGV